MIEDGETEMALVAGERPFVNWSRLRLNLWPLDRSETPSPVLLEDDHGIITESLQPQDSRSLATYLRTFRDTIEQASVERGVKEAIDQSGARQKLGEFVLKAAAWFESVADRGEVAVVRLVPARHIQIT